MKLFFGTAVALISMVPAIVSLTVNTPSTLTQCQPVKLTWVDGVPPYYVSIIPGGETSAPPLKDLGKTSAMSETWLVNVTPNQNVNIVVKDSTGDTAFTDQVLVLAADDASCMNDNTSVSQGSVISESGTSAASSSTGTSTQAVQGTTRTTVATTRAASKTSSQSTGTSHSNTNNGGSRSGGGFGAVVLLPIVGLVLF